MPRFIIMSYEQRKNDAKKKKNKLQTKLNGNTFTALRHDVFNSTQYFNLSFTAKALLVDAMAMYNMLNNGDLSFAYTIMKKRGWKSETTISKAIKELLAAQFLILTKQGGRHNRPNLYALSFFPINECLAKNGISKIDIKPTHAPQDEWKLSSKN